nr:hypothetical protein [uncultured Cohaesibacter sp.]
MKSHSLARELIALGEALLSAPNVETKNISSLLKMESQSSIQRKEMGMGITTMAHLSKYSKAEWIEFAEAHKIPINFNERDSSRNIMGKIMSYLAENESEMKRVRESVVDEGGSSNRLNSAFSILLRGNS